MAKILFNDELFNISEAALNAASERIMRVLSSVMNGTGATINFGGTTYNIDSTKLSTVTNSFISHLGTVSGSGMKVSVGGVEYNIDSSKMSSAVSQLHTVLSGLQSGENGDKYDDTYPIQWNTTEVMNNPSFVYSTVPMVKVSNLAPSTEELSNATLIANFDGMELVFTCTQSYEDNGASLIFFGNDTIGVDDFLMVSSASPTTLNGGDIISEAGLYFINLVDVNADCTLNIASSSKGQHVTVRTSKLNILDTAETTEGVFYKVSNLAPTISEIVGATVTMFNHADCESDTATMSEADCEIITDGVYVLGNVLLIVTADKVDELTKGAWVSAQLVGYAGDRTLSVYWGYDEEGIPMNEYGFYFGRKYTKASDKASVSMVFFEDGTVRTIWKDFEAGGDPVYWEDTATYSHGQIVVNGGDPITISNNGTKIDTGDMILTLEGSDDSGLNQYGFYFNKPYFYSDSAMLTRFTYIFYADGSAKQIALHPNNTNPIITEMPAGSLVYSQNHAEEIEGLYEINYKFDFYENGTKMSINGEVGFTLETTIYDDESPIEWNTVEVVNNAGYIASSDLSVVKISNLTPTKEELEASTLIANVQGQTMNVPCSDADDASAYAVYAVFNTPLGYVFAYSVHTTTKGIEPGLYISDVYTMAGVDADCRLELAPSNNGLVMNEYGFYFDAPYVGVDSDGTKATMIFYANGSAYVKEEKDGKVVFEWTTEPNTYTYEMNKISYYEQVYNITGNGTKIITATGELTLYAPKYDDTYPIEWNTMEVMNNASFYFEPFDNTRFVKISNLAPLNSKLYESTLTSNSNGQQLVVSGSNGRYDGAQFKFAGLGTVYAFSLTEGFDEYLSTYIPETGLYITDVATMLGINADCRLELAGSDTIKDPALNPEGVEVVNGEYAYGDYVYTAKMGEGGNMFGAATLEEAWQIVDTLLANMGLTWDEYVVMYQQQMEAEMGITWEEYASANGLSGSFEDMMKAEMGLTEETFVPTEISGWSVRVADTTKTEYGEILESINGVPVDEMGSTFQGCANLTIAPTIPSSVTTMRYTFYGCESLVTPPDMSSAKNVTDMEYAFYDCKALVEAPIIPEGVTNMRSTFAGCTALTATSAIPSNVSNMNHTFSGCKLLVTPPDMTNAKNVTDMEGTFNNCTSLATASIIPNSVTSMRNTFNNCISLAAAPAIPNSVTDMSHTFSGCESLVVLPDMTNANSVTNMSWTFYGCVNLTIAPVIPNSVTDMNHTFFNCYSLTTAPVIPNSVTDMQGTFHTCGQLKTYHGSVDAEGDFSHYIIPSNVLNMEDTFMQCREIILPPDMTNANSVTNMKSTFYNCSALTSAPVIPSGVTNMEYTFEGCASLVTPPDMTNANSVTNMHYAFYGCESLTSAPVIPNSVINMVYTFSRCKALITPPIIPNSVVDMMDAFSQCESLSKAPAIPENVTNMAYAFFQCTSMSESPDMTHAKNVTDMHYAFYGCESLTSAPVIPNSVTDMSHTFEGCISLVTSPDMTNANSVTNMYSTFYGCESLVTPPDMSSAKNVTDMEYAFYDCKALTIAPVIPNSVTNLDFAFDGCNSIKRYAGSTDPEGDFSHYIIPNGVTSLDQTFADWSYMTVAPSIPNSVTNMHGTFVGCVALITPPAIPSGVTNMSATFSRCISLISAPVIPSGVTDMGYTFTNCYKISSAPIIPNSVTNMRQTFQYCDMLTGTITIDANPTEYVLCFHSTRKPITLVGSSTMLAQLAATANNGNVTVG